MNEELLTSAEEDRAPRRQRRRLARELALKGTYQWLLSDNPLAQIEAQLAHDEDFPGADHELMLELLRGAVSRADLWRAELTPFLRRRVEELSPVEHAVLLIAAVELHAHPETAYKVILNEAIELTKRYGGTDGHKFINGVLDKYAAALRPDEVRSARQSSCSAPAPRGAGGTGPTSP